MQDDANSRGAKPRSESVVNPLIGTTARMRFRVVLPMGLALLWLAAVAAASGEGRLSLEPYIQTPHADDVGLFGTALRDLAEFPSAVLAGCVALMLFLVFEGVVRRTWDHPHEVAALVPAAVFAALPAQVAFQKILGAEAVLASLGVFLSGCWLALHRARPVALVGALIAAASTAVHPAMFVLAPAAVGCLWLGGTVRSVPLAFSATAAIWVVSFLASRAGIPAEAVTASVEAGRSRWALDLLASSPLYAFWSEPRHLLPTGYLAMRGDAWPIFGGLALWACLVGWSMLTTGIVRTAVIAAYAALAGAAPFVVPGWIPGDRAVALLPVIFALLLVAHLLSVVRGSIPQVTGIALSLVIAVVGAVLPHMGEIRRDERLATRQHLLMPDLSGLGFSPAAEMDPARLVLFGWDVLEAEKKLYAANKDRGTFPSYRIAVGSAARQRLQVPGPPVLDRDKLWALTTRLRVAIDASDHAEEAALLEKLDALEMKLREIDQERRELAAQHWYPSVQARLQALMGDAMEVIYALAEGRVRHPRFHRFRFSLVELMREAARWATELGDLQYSVPLREILVDLTRPARAPANDRERRQQLRHWRARALLGIELAEMKRVKEAREHLEAAIGNLPSTELICAVARATAASLARADGADPIDVLDGLNSAWSGVASTGRGGEGLPGITQPSSRDYWLVAEFLLLRYEIAKQFDASLEKQALHDVRLALAGPAIDERVRRVPALAFWGRLRMLQGEKEDARRVLLEMRSLKARTFGQRGSGMSGLLDTPRFRLVGLRTLLQVLDAESEADLVADVKAEIEALDRY